MPAAVARARGVSLWLMPAGEARAGLEAVVVGLAARLGTRPFAPHLTLLAGLEGPEERILARAASAAALVRPFRVRLVAVEGRDEHFRCLFARAAADEQLSAAHTEAARAFGREPDPAFLPHLSLVYGTLTSETKGALVTELWPTVPPSFDVRALHAWRTEGTVDTWRELAAWPLGDG